MVPHRIVARDALPRNANGKLEREALTMELSGLFMVGEA
jgi:acyl-coenzyme A synthetase/AMP-(fatty) acid ligase